MDCIYIYISFYLRTRIHLLRSSKLQLEKVFALSPCTYFMC